jgi:hypothetical protein
MRLALLSLAGALDTKLSPCDQNLTEAKNAILIRINAHGVNAGIKSTKEDAMTTARAKAEGKPIAATRDDLLHLFGDIDERKVLDILALVPTIAEIEEAWLWAAGDGDVLAKGGYSRSHTAAEIVNILIADEEEEPPKVR